MLAIVAPAQMAWCQIAYATQGCTSQPVQSANSFSVADYVLIGKSLYTLGDVAAFKNLPTLRHFA